MRHRVAVLFFGSLLALLAGLLMPSMAGQREAANKTRTVNNLKMIGLAFQNHNDTLNCLPFNGGTNDEKNLEAINYGWHNPNFRDSGTWATMILPYMEQDSVFKNNDIKGVTPPGLPEKYPYDKSWQVSIKELLCAERGRAGFSTSREKGCYPGPVTDFAINTFINAQPLTYSQSGYAKGTAGEGKNGDWAAANSKMQVQTIPDGSSNTILVGGKAMPPTKKAAAPMNCAPVPEGETVSGSGDEGIFSPGNWCIKGTKKTLTSTGTGRGHVVVAEPPDADPKEYPRNGGVPWMYADSELKGDKAPAYANAWGSAFDDGVIFMFGDGTVRMLKYKSRGTVNFARLLYPGDGNVTTFDD